MLVDSVSNSLMLACHENISFTAEEQPFDSKNMFKDVHKCSKMITNVQRCSQMFKDVQFKKP